MAEQMLLEQFWMGLPKEMAAHVIEKAFTNLEEAANAADMYEVTHQQPYFVKNP